MSEQQQNNWAARRGTFTQLVAAIVGALVATAMQLAVPVSDHASLAHLENGPPALRGMLLVPHLLEQYYIQLTAFVVFAGLAAYKRQEPGAWTYAFVFGLAFPGVVIFHWLR